VRYLTIDECRRLINTAEGEFRNLVRAALLTGCRFGELATLQVDDFNRDAGTLQRTRHRASSTTTIGAASGRDKAVRRPLRARRHIASRWADGAERAAGTFGAYVGGCRVSNIEFPDCPDWVPSSVLDAAKDLFPLSPHVIRRLVTDPRMEGVWRTLRQKRRSYSGRYKHSRAPDWPDAWEGLQQQHMRELFVVAAASYYYCPPAITRRDLAKLRRPYFDAITRLENAKRSLQDLGIGRENEISVIDGLILECKM
jgi:integrase